MDDVSWQLFFDTIGHGEKEHRAWLRGMLAGFASAVEGRPVKIEDGATNAS